jgi:hypothetical protein
MKIKLYNKVTEETEIKEVLDYTEHSITEQAGRGIMVTNYDDNYEISEYNEQ